MTPTPVPLLSVRGVHKDFGATPALRGVLDGRGDGLARQVDLDVVVESGRDMVCEKRYIRSSASNKAKIPTASVSWSQCRCYCAV